VQNVEPSRIMATKISDAAEWENACWKWYLNSPPCDLKRSSTKDAVMPARHPCPNCGELRQGPRTTCSKCSYPNHKGRQEHTATKRQIKHPPLQFHIRALLAATVIVAIFCAITRSGADAMWNTIGIVGVLFPVIEFFYYFWINVTSDRPDATKSHEDRFQ